jgi:hypothetical protein
VDPIALPPLTVARYRFELKLSEQADLPHYLGGMLRGGFGFTFKRLVCMQRHLKQCDNCVLLHTCAYPAVFQPAPPPDAGVLTNHDRIPVPYVLEPPARRKVPWQAGESLPFGLVLIGEGSTYLPYFVLAFQQLGREGLGRSCSQAELSGVLTAAHAGSSEVALWQAGSLRRDWKTVGLQHAPEMLNTNGTCTSITVGYQTPTRLKYRGLYLEKAPPFHVLFRALLRRVSSLSYFYAGRPWDIDYRGWIEKAKQVRIDTADVRWQDWDRYSTRQQQYMNLGGVVGTVTYTPSLDLGTDLGPFLPLLRLGELIHVGKGTSFGNGRYELVDGHTAR